MLKNGGPAFPSKVVKEMHDGSQSTTIYWGMTLRDWFAGKAMESLLRTAILPSGNTEDYAKCAYDMADAMLKEADRRNGK